MLLRRPPAASVALIVMFASTVVVTAAVGGPATAAPVVEVTVLTVNDFHGRIDENTTAWATTIETERASAPGGAASVALVSAGDNIGASLFASAIADDQPTIDVFNALEFDASSVGNHEFDRGWLDFRDRYIDGTLVDVVPAAFPYLAANVYDTGTGQPILPEFALIDLTASGEPLTLAVVGAVTADTPSLVTPSGVAGLEFRDPVDEVNRVVVDLTDGDPANGEADVIVAAYHEGGPENVPPGSLESMLAASPVFASIVNETSSKVDAIITGHTHRAYALEAPVPGVVGATRPIVQTGSYGVNVGRIDMSIDAGAEGMPVTEFAVSNVARAQVADTNLPRVALVEGIVANALTDADVIGAQPVGSVSADITTAFSGGSYVDGVYTGGTRDDRSKESALGNLVADSMLASLSAFERGGAEITVMNPGGLRAELFYDPDGEITYAEANSVLPFVNNLETISLSGAEFWLLLEQQWQRNADNTVPGRAYLQLGLSANVSYTYDPALAEGSRITSITVDGAPIDLAREYRIGTNSFLIEGGDNFRAFRQGSDRRDSGLVDRDAWIEYLADNSPLAPDFAKRAAQVVPLPAGIVPGARLIASVSDLDLTSVGAPATTTLEISVGGRPVGSVPVVAGVAAVDVTVPSLPAGLTQLVMVAQPSGTSVTVPVMVVDTLSPISPVRVFDTRAGQSPDALRAVPKVPVGPANILEVQMTDLPGHVPLDGVASVSLNVVATNAVVPGFITVFPCGRLKEVSSVNFEAGATVANAVIAPVSPRGKVCFHANTPVDVVVDVNGWYAEDAAFTAIAPERLLDTRPGQSPGAVLDVGKTTVNPRVLEVKVTGIQGVTPASGVAAVSLSVVATGATVPGFVTVFPCGTPNFVSSVNFVAGQTVANAVIAPVSATGTVCFSANTPVNVVADVNGWFATGSSFRPIGPDRLFDTRANNSPQARLDVAKRQVGSSGEYVLEVDLDGLGQPLPTAVNGPAEPAVGWLAVSLNLVATGSAAPGFVTVYPCGVRREVSSVNFAAGQTVANAVTTAVSATGTVCFYSNTPVDVVADINAYFVGAPLTQAVR